MMDALLPDEALRILNQARHMGETRPKKRMLSDEQLEHARAESGSAKGSRLFPSSPPRVARS